MSKETKRIEELSTMLNHAKDEQTRAVENERDACARAIKEEIEDEELDFDENFKKGLNHALGIIESRKDHSVRWIQEITNGTVLGEFIERIVDERVKEIKDAKV